MTETEDPGQVSLKTLKTLKLSHLYLLKMIARNGALARAAEETAQTQSAVTKSLQNIEACLGVTLFERKGRGVKLTPAGEAFLPHAQKILSEFRHATDHLAALTEGAAGAISVGTLIAASPRLLPEALLAFQRAYPDVMVTIREGTNEVLYPALYTGELDLIVGRLSVFCGREGIKQQALYDENIVFVSAATHPVAKESLVSLAQLADLKWLFPPEETTLRRELARMFHEHSIPIPRHRYESISILTNLPLLSEGEFIGALPLQVFEAYKDMFNLVALPINASPILGPVGISMRDGDTPTQTTMNFIAHLKSAARALKSGDPV
ncbi:MAG: LysR family transcriptional regulator [Parvularculaceae bacterium]|nr:LysR family transcriptional regulator [Parvularculaceae bacterium]